MGSPRNFRGRRNIFFSSDNNPGIPLGRGALPERRGGVERRLPAPRRVLETSDDVAIQEEGAPAQFGDPPAEDREGDVGLVVAQGGVREARGAEGRHVTSSAVHGG